MRTTRGLLAVVGWSLCAGCIIAPLPTYHLHPESPREPISDKALAFMTAGSTTMEEVLLRFGAPEIHYTEPAVFQYRWRTVVSMVSLYPVPEIMGKSCVWHTLRITFDDAGRVSGYQKVQFPPTHFGPKAAAC